MGWQRGGTIYRLCDKVRFEKCLERCSEEIFKDEETENAQNEHISCS